MALFTGLESVWRFLPRGRNGWGSVVQTGEHCGLWVDGFSGIAGRGEFGDKPPTSPEEGDNGVNRQRVLAKRYCRSHMFERRMENRQMFQGGLKSGARLRWCAQPRSRDFPTHAPLAPNEGNAYDNAG